MSTGPRRTHEYIPLEAVVLYARRRCSGPHSLVEAVREPLSSPPSDALAVQPHVAKDEVGF